MSDGLGDACPTVVADVVGILKEPEAVTSAAVVVNWDAVLDSSCASELASETV